MNLLPEDIIKLVLAVVFGAVIGAEREFRDKSAGLRTLIFICMGATLFTLYSLKLGGEGDQVRIAANVVSGVGFLGAGAILRDGNRVTGLTTAAMIWLAAALGMGIGGGHFLLSLAALAVIITVLWGFPRVEAHINALQDVHTYSVVCPSTQDNLQALDQLFQESGLRVVNRNRMKAGEDMSCEWVAVGSRKDHEQLVEKLFQLSIVKEMRA